MSSQIYGLVYSSESTFHFSQLDLTELLSQSRKDNARDGITGLLLYVNGNFMQLLEGAREKIEALLVRIRNDTRHHHLVVLEEGPIERRHFSDWSMAFLDFTSAQVRALPGYSTFLEAPSCEKDLEELSDRNVRLLHYFRAVMTASDSSTLRLAEAVEFQPPDPARKDHPA